MTVPNVTMRWAQNKAQCHWCEKEIVVSTAMVAVFFWNKGDDGRRWNTQYCYHPECWLAKGYDYLEQNPYKPYPRGRKRLELIEEDRRQRYLITRRYHALRQRLNMLDNGSEPLKALNLECQMSELMLEMQKIGGVPKKWLERL